MSGHGVPAALIASMVKLAVASQRAVAADPSQFMSGMNSGLLGNTQNQFVQQHTDGILEASNAAGDFFGQDALCDLLTETRGLSPALAADRVISSVRQWSGKQDDDLTVLICDYMPTVGETVRQEC